MSEIAQTDNFNDRTNIKVVGVGGAGGNAVNRMIAEGLQNVQFVAINTDAKDLLRSDADVKISLNAASSRGLGAGADPERGSKAAQDHQSDIEEATWSSCPVARAAAPAPARAPSSPARRISRGR